MKRSLLIFVLAASLFGCVNAPTQTQFATADFGPFPTNYEAIIRSYYEARLKDPGSVIYKPIASPQKYWFGDRFSPAGKYGYLVCATFNAKNAYGGYVGYRTDGFVIRGGVIINFLKDGEYAAEKVC